MSERRITLNLMCHGVVAKEYTEVPASEARQLLKKRMATGWYWAIDPPDKTGAIPDDVARYAADCEACGVTDPTKR